MNSMVRVRRAAAARIPAPRIKCSRGVPCVATTCASSDSNGPPAARRSGAPVPARASPLQANVTLGRLARLTREQLQFVEVFIRCRGKIKDVEEELGISYPTVVARLNEVVQAMGFEVRQEDADLSGRRQQILDELASGKLSAADAAIRLRSL